MKLRNTLFILFGLATAFSSCTRKESDYPYIDVVNDKSSTNLTLFQSEQKVWRQGTFTLTCTGQKKDGLPVYVSKTDIIGVGRNAVLCPVVMDGKKDTLFNIASIPAAKMPAQGATAEVQYYTVKNPYPNKDGWLPGALFKQTLKFEDFRLTVSTATVSVGTDFSVKQFLQTNLVSSVPLDEVTIKDPNNVVVNDVYSPGYTGKIELTVSSTPVYWDGAQLVSATAKITLDVK